MPVVVTRCRYIRRVVVPASGRLQSGSAARQRQDGAGSSSSGSTGGDAELQGAVGSSTRSRGPRQGVMRLPGASGVKNALLRIKERALHVSYKAATLVASVPPDRAAPPLQRLWTIRRT